MDIDSFAKILEAHGTDPMEEFSKMREELNKVPLATTEKTIKGLFDFVDDLQQEHSEITCVVIGQFLLATGIKYILSNEDYEIPQAKLAFLLYIFDKFLTDTLKLLGYNNNTPFSSEGTKGEELELKIIHPASGAIN